MSAGTAKCKARLLSDPTGQTECDKYATSVDGRLCAFHSRQCQGLYRGYKRRNAQLDALSASIPPFLAESKVPLVNQTFKDVADKETLTSIFQYLFRRYNLLEKVIRGRKLHHSHFFAIDYDYGHEKYLAQLQKERFTVSRALERLGKRSSQVLYSQKKWLDWVEECQEEEENHRENESKKVKLEAQLFKRHQKELERRQRELREKENSRLQDQALEEAYAQKLEAMSEEAQDEWDPIRDVVDGERANFVELIKYFLMIKEPDESKPSDENREAAENTHATPVGNTPLSKSAKKRARKIKSAADKPTTAGAEKDADARGPDTIEMETKAQIRKRLQEGVEYSRKSGYYVVSTLETPVELYGKAAAIPDDEIDTLLEEIAEVKMMLFCRLLLSHASLLPIALKAESVEDFLDHAEVTLESLRDLCLKVERPALQDVRDACADFVRAKAGEEEEDDELEEGAEEDWETEDEERPIPKKYEMNFVRPDRTMPEVFRTKREQRKDKQRQQVLKHMGINPQEHAVDFGATEEEQPNNKIRIKICGRYISHYPSEKALSRGGWYHFCLIAKDSDLHDAIELCRNWEEFFELNTLCIYHYFPAAKWMVWVGDHDRLQLLRMGFIPYFQSNRADLLTFHEQTGSRGMARRSHHYREARNFICGHIKRNDPASRRLIQYLSMLTFEVIVLVRDAKTGKILVKPPKEERWLVREKSGWGRASKNEYTDIVRVGPEFFETMDKYRKWHFNFDDHYDIYLWDASSTGRDFAFLYSRLFEVLVKAHRVRQPKDIYKVVGPIIKTLTRDPVTQRTRTIKPGEEIDSIWDQLEGPNQRVTIMNKQTGEEVPDHFETVKYNEADELEDEILFPEEADEESTNNLFRPDNSAMTRFEQGKVGDMRRFIYDLDSDEELSDYPEDPEDSDWDGYESRSGSEMYSGDEFNDDDVFFESEEAAEKWEREQQQKQVMKHDPQEAQAAWDEFSRMFKDHLKIVPGGRRQHSVLDYFNDPKKPLDLSMIPADMRKSDADVMALMRLSLMKERNYQDTPPGGMKAEFDRYLDREKAKVFKQSWHQADLTPDARRLLFTQTMLTRMMDEYQMTKLTLGPFELIAAMGIVNKTTIDKRIADDAFLAYSAISLFFEADDFLKSRHGSIFTEPQFQTMFEGFPQRLLNQSERAKTLPNRRTNQSNKTMPRSHWSEWDKIAKKNEKAVNEGEIEKFYPIEWDKVVRPKIARLYKAGVICNTYDFQTAGIAIAAKEPGRGYDLYMDYRLECDRIRQLNHLQDPRQFARDKLLEKARDFARTYPQAKFAALRIWSGDQFYPLMLGYHNRPLTSFIDSKGRGWEWKFIPKDMPFSEWSIQEQCRLRLKPYADFFGDKVIVATDMYFVMGRDEKELRKLAAGVTFAVQTEPWRMEIDLWRSFVNVDLQFLEGLETEWLETVKDGQGGNWL